MERSERLFLWMVVAMTLWGGGWVALKVLTAAVSFEVITFWRFAIMFVAFLPLILWMKRPIVIPYRSIKYIIAGAGLNVAFMVVAFFGVKYGSAGGGGVIITTLSPLVTFALAAVIYKKRLTASQVMGLSLGMVGGLIMLQAWESGSGLFSSANLFYMLAALIWAVVTLLSQASHIHIYPLHYSFAISFVGTMMLMPFNTLSELAVVFDQDGYFWISLIYLGVLGQTVATTIYFFASAQIGSGKASSFMFIVPFSALFFAALFLKEPLQMHIVAGGVVSILAVVLINRKH